MSTEVTRYTFNLAKPGCASFARASRPLSSMASSRAFSTLRRMVQRYRACFKASRPRSLAARLLKAALARPRWEC